MTSALSLNTADSPTNSPLASPAPVINLGSAGGETPAGPAHGIHHRRRSIPLAPILEEKAMVAALSVIAHSRQSSGESDAGPINEMRKQFVRDTGDLSDTVEFQEEQIAQLRSTLRKTRRCGLTVILSAFAVGVGFGMSYANQLQQLLQRSIASLQAPAEQNLVFKFFSYLAE